jgi:preprotein translocase subunit YajC
MGKRKPAGSGLAVLGLLLKNGPIKAMGGRKAGGLRIHKEPSLPYTHGLLFLEIRPVLISNAYAQAAGASQDPLIGFLPLILMFVVLYFLMIRPQMKRAKEHRQLVEGLQKGDEIVSSAGIVGKVTEVDDAYITVDVGSGDKQISMVMQRQAVQTLLPKGTIKTIS